MQPTGLEKRPVNAAIAATCGRTGRKEAAKQGKRAFSGTPRTLAEGLCPSTLPIDEWMSDYCSLTR